MTQSATHFMRSRLVKNRFFNTGGATRTASSCLIREMKYNLTFPALILTCLLLISAVNAFSQTNTGSIKGTVTDEHGAAFPSVTVDIESASGQRRSIQTDVDGGFDVPNLPPGKYTVIVMFLNMDSKSYPVVVRANQATTYDVVLSPKNLCRLRAGEKAMTITDADRKEIISLILHHAIERRNIPDYNLLIEKKIGKIALALENLKASWVTIPDDIEMTLMTKKEIKNLANRKGDFLYLEFSKWTIGAECIVLTLSNGWMAASNSDAAYVSGGGITYRLKKTDGRWSLENVGGWIS